MPGGVGTVLRPTIVVVPFRADDPSVSDNVFAGGVSEAIESELLGVGGRQTLEVGDGMLDAVQSTLEQRRLNRIPKLFRSGPLTRALFAEPFVSNWVFDVEILARLIERQRSEGGPRADECVRELPLLQWIDVAGTKLRPFDFARAVLEMARIHRRYLRRPRPTA